jgi:hypothetical protein
MKNNASNNRKVWYLVCFVKKDAEWWNGKKWLSLDDAHASGRGFSNIAVVYNTRKKAEKIARKAIKGTLIKRFIKQGVLQDREYIFDFEEK